MKMMSVNCYGLRIFDSFTCLNIGSVISEVSVIVSTPISVTPNVYANLAMQSTHV